MTIVYIRIGAIKEVLERFKTEDEAFAFCNTLDWQFEDANGIIWELTLEA